MNKSKKIIALILSTLLILSAVLVSNAVTYSCPACKSTSYSFVGIDYYCRGSAYPNTHSVYAQYRCNKCYKSFSICLSGSQACTYGSNWYSDRYEHWHKCTLCGGLSTPQPHRWDSGLEFVKCKDCGYLVSLVGG